MTKRYANWTAELDRLLDSYRITSAEYWEALHRLEQRVRARKGFQWHLLIYTIVTLICISNYLFVSLLIGDWIYPWLVWAIGGLSAILLCHYLGVYLFNQDFRLRIIQKELQKMGVSEHDIRENRQTKVRSFSKAYHEAYPLAVRKMRATLSFFWHGVIYLILNGLCLISYIVPSIMVREWLYPWFIWSAFGLSVAMFSHLAVVLYLFEAQRGRRT